MNKCGNKQNGVPSIKITVVMNYKLQKGHGHLAQENTVQNITVNMWHHYK